MPNRTQDARSSLPWNEDLPSERMAGAEFVLPWLIDRFSGMLAILHGRFTPAEAWLIVEMHEHVTPGNPLRDDVFTASRVRSAIEHSKCADADGTDPDGFLAKLSAFDEQQLALLRIWASAYWEQAAPEGTGIARYIAY
ncbi:MAG: hypothetical protein MJ061_04690 [Mailhella sp.]|nr:hypothetical protein [Mailhella sp.]